MPPLPFAAPLAAATLAFAALPATPALAQVQKTGNFLSLDLALEAARVCSAQGWPVSVAVVDTAGNVKLQAKGDHSTIHTKDSSFRKAYTVVTMGPIFGFDRLGAWVEKLKSNPGAPGGDKDEDCALAGLDKIKNRLPQ